MTPDRDWIRAKQVFADALERPASERADFVSGACQGEEPLRARVEELLAAHSRLGGFLRPPDSPELVEEVPEAIGPYRVERELGRGGMGTVYLAEDPRLGREVAIKRLPDDCFMDPKRRALFEREARTAAHLNDPNIATIYELGEADERTYIAMEYVPGCSLGDYLREHGALSVDETLEIAIQIAQGLVAAHKSGIVHRDLKPGNLMISEDGRVKILDFGLAKAVHSEPLDGAAVRRRRSPDGSTMGAGFLGTVGYSSPEQCSGGVADARSDLFSLGVILREMLDGEAPFRRDTPSGTLEAVLSAPAAPAGPGRSWPSDLAAILERLLAKDPEERLGSTEQVLAELQAVRARLRGGWRRWAWPLATGVAATVALVVFLGRGDPFQVLRDRMSTPDPDDTYLRDTLEKFGGLRQEYGDGNETLRSLQGPLLQMARRSFARAREALVEDLAAGRFDEAREALAILRQRQDLWEGLDFDLSEAGPGSRSPSVAAAELLRSAEAAQSSLCTQERFEELLSSEGPPFDQGLAQVEALAAAQFEGRPFAPARERAELLRAAYRENLLRWVDKALRRGAPEPAERAAVLTTWSAVRARVDPDWDRELVARLDRGINELQCTVWLDDRLAEARGTDEVDALRTLRDAMAAQREEAEQTDQVGLLCAFADDVRTGRALFGAGQLAPLDDQIGRMQQAAALLSLANDCPLAVRFAELRTAADWLGELYRAEDQADLALRAGTLAEQRAQIPVALPRLFEADARRLVEAAEVSCAFQQQAARATAAERQCLDRIRDACVVLDPEAARSALEDLKALRREGGLTSVDMATKQVEELLARLDRWYRVEAETLPTFLRLLRDARFEDPEEDVAELRGQWQVLNSAWEEERAALQAATAARAATVQALRLARLEWRLALAPTTCLATLEPLPESPARSILQAQATFAQDPHDPEGVRRSLAFLREAGPLAGERGGELYYLRGSYQHVLARLMEEMAAADGVRSAEIDVLLEGAFKDLETARESYGRKTADLLYQLAALAYRRSEWDPGYAGDAAEEAAAYAGEAASAPFTESEVVDALGGFRRAADAAELRRFQSEVYVVEANARVLLGDWARVIEACSRALAVTPGRPLPWYLRSGARGRQEGEREESARDLAQARATAERTEFGSPWYEESRQVLDWLRSRADGRP